MSTIGKEVIERIKELQNARNWTNSHLAEQADLSTATLSNWYKRKASPSVPAIQKLCVAFGISVSDFFDKERTRTELTVEQKELLDEWNLLHGEIKSGILDVIKKSNEIHRNSNPL